MAVTEPEDQPQAFEHLTGKTRMPEPAWGHMIVRLILVEKKGRIIVPAPGATGRDMQPESERKNYRFRVVKCSKQYLRGLQVLDTPFSVGDFVLIKSGPNTDWVQEPFPIMLPDLHMVVNIGEHAAWIPGNLAEQKALDS